jgi:hypothetical protein
MFKHIQDRRTMNSLVISPRSAGLNESSDINKENKEQCSICKNNNQNDNGH